MTKYMTKLENTLMGEGLTQNTAEQYVKRLVKANKGQTYTSLTFLRKPQVVMENMKEAEYSASSMESFVAMFVSILGKVGGKLNNKAKKEYEAILVKPDEYFVKRERGVKTENQEKNWLSKEDFDKYVNETKTAGETASRKRKNFTTKDYDAVLNWFIISLYTLLPPRRNKDYMLMKLNGEGNVLDIKNSKMIFRDYKTAGKYGEQTTDLTDYPEFLKVLKIYLKHRNDESDYLLTFHDGKYFSQTNTMTRILNKIFGGNKVSSTAIRSMYLTTKYGGEQNEEIKKDADMMAHGIQAQQTTYIK